MKIRRIISALVLVILLGGYFYLNPLLPIITGYSAKNLSSGVFVAGRTQESIEDIDLNFSFIKMNKNKIDWDNKEVKSSFLWHTSTSVYIDGLGCCLINDASKEDVKKFSCSPIEVNEYKTDTILWPKGDMMPDSFPTGINMDKIAKTMEQAFADTIPYKGTFAVMVVYKGQPVVERYREGFSSENKFLSWSMAKSFTNALTGILVKQGKLDINKPIGFDEWKNDNRKYISINNLMHMNSGLNWNEDYGNSSDVNNMLFKEGNMAQFTINKPYKYRADSAWVYSSGSTNIVSSIIRNTFTNDDDYHAFPRLALFNKIGMESAIWEVDASGTFVGSSYIYATMRDYARFGLLYLNDGYWMGEQILPKGWVDYTTSASNGSEGQYGAFFWLNKSGIDYPDVPRDMFCCRGHDGQYIYIIPSKDLVVVRTGFSKKGMFDYNKFLSDIVNAIE